MKKFRVGISPTLTNSDGSQPFPSYDLSALAADPAFEIETFKASTPLAASDIENYDALVLLGEIMAADSFAGNGRLAVIGRMGVGYDTVDVPSCTRNNVALTITPESARRPMAQAALTLILALAGKLMVKDQMTRRGPDGWAERTNHHGLGLYGRTLGVIGVGNIGKEFLKVVKPFDMRIVGYDPLHSATEAAALGYELMSTEDVFREADFLSLHCPLNENTRHLVNVERLNLMKPEAYVINTARGPVVDQNALTEVLLANKIAGAGLDVFDVEPSPADERLNAMDNVILTPHAMGWTDQMFHEMAVANMAAFRAVADGQNPSHVVNAEVLDKVDFKAKLGGFND